MAPRMMFDQELAELKETGTWMSWRGLKVVTDLERIGDHAADIAELAVRMKDNCSFVILKYSRNSSHRWRNCRLL